MKSFQIRMLSTRGLAMSLLGLCLLSGLDTAPVYADFTFGEPTNLGPAINGPGEDCGPCLSPDGLELYFHRMVGNICEIWVAGRATLDSGWEPATRLGPPLNTADNGSPFLTSDGLSLYFDGERPGGNGSWDLWVTTRATVDDNWGAPSNLGAAVNSASEDWAPTLSADGLELYFTSNRSGGHGKWDLWVTTRQTVDDNWSTPVNLGQMINTSAQENWPGISADGLLLFFGSSRSGGIGSWDLYMTRRATRKDPWGPSMNVGPTVNSTPWQVGSRISANGSTLYFQSPRSGGLGRTDIWQVPIVPIVDFNDDGIVDAADVCIMVEHWYTDYPSCDIGPMPWGDGIIDVQDLIVLAEHLFEEVPLAQ